MKDEVNKDIRPNQGRLRSLPIRGEEREKTAAGGEKKKEHNAAGTPENQISASQSARCRTLAAAALSPSSAGSRPPGILEAFQ